MSQNLFAVVVYVSFVSMLFYFFFPLGWITAIVLLVVFIGNEQYRTRWTTFLFSTIKWIGKKWRERKNGFRVGKGGRNVRKVL